MNPTHHPAQEGKGRLRKKAGHETLWSRALVQQASHCPRRPGPAAPGQRDNRLLSPRHRSPQDHDSVPCVAAHRGSEGREGVCVCGRHHTPHRGRCRDPAQAGRPLHRVPATRAHWACACLRRGPTGPPHLPSSSRAHQTRRGQRLFLGTSRRGPEAPEAQACSVHPLPLTGPGQMPAPQASVFSSHQGPRTNSLLHRHLRAEDCPSEKATQGVPCNPSVGLVVRSCGRPL